jgi:hypothetical protein
MSIAVPKLDTADVEVHPAPIFRGSLGPVHTAKLRSTGADAVVKKFAGQDRASRKTFDEDSQLMACQSGHPHVVALLGITDFPNNWQIFEMTRMQARAVCDDHRSCPLRAHVTIGCLALAPFLLSI